MHDALGKQARARLTGLLPGIELGAADELSNVPRSMVYRLHIGSTKDGTDSAVIVKWFTAGGTGRIRESAASLDLPGAGLPALVAESVDPPVVVMADLGHGRSLADALLGGDPAQARTALVAWALAVAGLHSPRAACVRSSVRRSPPAVRTCGYRPCRSVPMSRTPSGCSSGSAHRSECRYPWAPWGNSVPWRSASVVTAMPPLTAADTCPDNNLLAGDQLTLLDFEGAQWRHIAWYVAYLTVPWPTCWCSWRLPADATEQALDAYAVLAGPSFAGVADAGFGADVSPSKRAVVLHRLRGARRAPGAPALAELAHHLHADLEHRWGAVPLPLAPAFR